MVKKLRFASKHVFLTYPKCSIPLEDVLDLLKLKLRDDHNSIKSYIISHELHKDGTDHRHCWLELSRAPERVPADYFDLDGHHGMYLTIKFEDNCAKYVLKGGDYISNIGEEELEAKVARAIAGTKSIKLNKDQIARRVLNGESLVKIVQDCPAVLFELSKLRDNMLLYKQLSSTAKPLEKLENKWIWGPTGSGKSKYVSETYPDCHKKPREVFWDSYEFEDIVVMEDVDETWEDVLWELKIWADHYPFSGRIKHKPSLKMRPKQIIITSNYTIAEVMERIFKRKGIRQDDMLVRALERRFESIYMGYTERPKDLDIFPDNYFYEQKENIDDNLFMDITYDKFIEL